MQHKTKLGLVMVAIFAIMASLQLPAYAQTGSIVVNLTDAQTVEVIAVGVFAGLVMAFQQERTATTPVSAFAFLNLAVQTTIVSIPIAIASALTQTNLNLLGLVLVFFASIGATVQLQKLKQPTISASARKPLT